MLNRKFEGGERKVDKQPTIRLYENFYKSFGLYLKGGIMVSGYPI